MEVSIHCGILTRRWWVACRRFVARSSREKNFRGVPWRSPEDERHGVSCRSFGGSTSEREGVSFKLEIASSAAMMGRKLGAKLNARREECKRERERERIGSVKQRNETSNNILIFVHKSKITRVWTAVLENTDWNYLCFQISESNSSRRSRFRQIVYRSIFSLKY